MADYQIHIALDSFTGASGRVYRCTPRGKFRGVPEGEFAALDRAHYRRLDDPHTGDDTAHEAPPAREADAEVAPESAPAEDVPLSDESPTAPPKKGRRSRS